MKFPVVNIRRVVAVALLCGTASAHAQLGLPSLPLPNRIGPLGLDGVRRPVDRLLDRAPLPDLGSLRLDTVRRLLRDHPDQVEADPRGEPALRGEVLAGSPSGAALQAARDAGAVVVRDEALPGLGERIVVLRLPAGAMSHTSATAAMVERLRAIDPDGSYDFNHVYTGSGAAGGVRAGEGAAVRVGLVDSGVDGAHPVFEEAAIVRWGCGGQAIPAPHGTAVAALMVGRSDYLRGAAPGASLYAADVYCGSPVGGAADRIAAALGWLDQQDVGVVNISLVGPSNALLARAVAAMQARGHLLVAAVGNDGPAAPPLYPASYPGVVGVTGVDRRGRPLPEAARGPQVKFAAPGSQMVSATPGTPPYRQVRGTSFAAPIVAALLAQRLPRPDRAAAARAVDALAREAGGAVANDETGYGVVGAKLRTDPADLR
jgi:hypothetical protein